MQTLATFSLIGAFVATGPAMAQTQPAAQAQTAAAPAFKAKKLTRAEFDALRGDPASIELT